MNEIKIFSYIIKLNALSNTVWETRVKIYEKLAEIYEEEINSSGGIYGRKVKLICKSFTETGDNLYTKIIDHLNQDNNYSIVISTADNNRVKEIFKKVDFKKFLFFSTDSNVLIEAKQKPYFFQVSGVTRSSKVESAKFYIQNDFKGNKICFLHEGKRYKNDLLPVLKDKKRKSVDFDISQVKPNQYDLKLTPLLDKLSKNDLLILDVSPLKLIHVLNYFNNSEKKPTILKLYGLIDGRVSEYNFPIIEIAGERSLNSLSFQALCDKIRYDLSSDEKDFISSAIFRFEIPLFLNYVTKNKIFYKSDLFKSLSKDINEIDGSNDVFIGKAKTYSFKNNINTNLTSFNYLIPRSLQSDGQISRIYYPTQFFVQKDSIVKVNVNYAYIDVIRITQIDIGESIWSCEFFIDINSLHKDPLGVIQFNNLSLLNSKFETKLVKQTKDKEFGGVNYRYYIVANFDFLAIADNYPFDWQHIYISMSISDQEKYGILQPIPEALLDKEFQLDGWKLMDSKTGILRKKETHHQNANLTKEIEIREEIRIGWTIARTSVVTTMKVAVPLIFLFFLNYYTVFLPFADAKTAIGVLTTTFLSGIALYFSTEKPQPLRITTIDLIFIYYYLQVGITVLITGITSFINEDIYNNSMISMRYILPLSIIIALIFLYKRIKSVRLMPRID
jgi:hypothetical protein